MMSILKIFALGASISLLSMVKVFAAAAQEGDIVIEVSGVRHQDGGDIIAVLYKGEETWLRKDKDYARKAVTAGDPAVSLRFEALPYGQDYALFIFHDRNKNAKLDFRKFPFPKPKEGIAVSNNAVRWGRPIYQRAKFSLSAQECVMPLKITY
jgi:uncharacterized protein (DUF2141 family)